MSDCPKKWKRAINKGQGSHQCAYIYKNRSLKIQSITRMLLIVREVTITSFVAQRFMIMSEQVLTTGAKLKSEFHAILFKKTSILNLMTFL